MEWTLTAPIISHEKNYRFQPLTNKHHEIIIKYCTGKDNPGLVMFMQDLLKELCLDKSIVFSDLPAIDQLFLMVRIRSICIGTALEVVVEEKIDGENVPVTHKVSLIDFQKSINKHYVQPITVTSDNGDIKTTVHYPKTWDSPQDYHYLKKICVDDKELDLEKLSETEIIELISNMYRTYQLDIAKAIETVKNSINKMVFVRIPGETPGLDDPDITINPDQFSHIIRVVYSDTLSNFAELMYVFVKVMNFTLSDAMKLTPADTQLYYQMFVKEMNEKEKAARSAQQAQNSRSTRQVPSR